VISAEYGRVKPHPGIFMHCLSGLEVMPEEAIFVGNSWEEDIAGARNAGGGKSANRLSVKSGHFKNSNHL